jgi:hypothetical protein
LSKRNIAVPDRNRTVSSGGAAKVACRKIVFAHADGAGAVCHIRAVADCDSAIASVGAGAASRVGRDAIICSRRIWTRAAV